MSKEERFQIWPFYEDEIDIARDADENRIFEVLATIGCALIRNDPRPGYG